MLTHSRVIVLPWLLLVAASLQAADLFDSSGVLGMTIEGPFARLLDGDEHEELQFALSVEGDTLPVRIRTRGKSRLRVCRFPPLRINFRKGEAGGVFSGQDKLKLVTHCKASHQRYLLTEYAVYRMFNVITDLSYRVRLARISYVDTAGESIAEQPAFFIEPARQLGSRLGATPVSRPHLTLGQLDDQQAALMFVFQYMVGNTDWSLVTADGDDECCHNVDLLERDGKLVTVPYDFDLAGLVKSPYARPDPSLGISRVTTRRYRGYCLPAGAVGRALRTVRDKEPQILDALISTPGIDDATIESGKKYLDRFFRQARRDARLAARLESRCL